MALLLAAVVVLLVAVAAAYVWYQKVGWIAISAAAGDTVAWTPAGGKAVTSLRFKDCKFAVTRGDGATIPGGAQDVTGVLNAMAAAFEGSTIAPAALSLHSPLSGFSFVVKGFNDATTVPPTMPAASSPWCSGVDASGACIVLPAKSATLTGWVRTL